MNPDQFIKETYRRMSARSQNNTDVNWEWHNLENFLNQESAKITSKQYTQILPKDKNAKILDIGFGTGWFMAACIKMGYKNIYGADFFGKEKTQKVADTCGSIKEIFDIKTNIGDFLLELNQKFDFL